MKILAWNIEYGGYKSYKDKSDKPQKMGKIVEAIREIGAEVVSLVDVYRWGDVYPMEKLKKIFGYKYAVWTPSYDGKLEHNRGQLGVMIMTNLTVKGYEILKAEGRNFMTTTVGTTKNDVDIVTVHLNYASETKREKETREVLKRVRKGPTIIVGDFNTIDADDLEATRKVTDYFVIRAGSTIKGVRKIITEMYKSSITQLYKSAGMRDLGKGRGNTFPTFKIPLVLQKPAARLDYAFGSEQIKLINFEVLRDKKFDKLSDHYPILVEIEI